MKRFLFPLMAASLLACGEPKKESNLVQFDSLADYPEKQLVLEDIADVSYIFLDDQDDEFLFRGTPISITSKTITVADQRLGDFFLFDSSGTPISKFNHKGSGPGDYTGVIAAFVDEVKEELFVVEKNRIQVYDKTGNFKRTLRLPKDTYVLEAMSYDEGSIILMDNYLYMTGLYENMAQKEADIYQSPFVRISKTDGSLIENIAVPYDFSFGLNTTVNLGNNQLKVGGPLFRLSAHKEGVLINCPDIDTLFLYNGKELLPQWKHLPTVKEMETMNYINGYVESAGYQFFEKVTLKIDKMPPPPSTYYLYDTKAKQFFEQKITLQEYPDKEITITPLMLRLTRDAHLGFVMLPAHELKEAYDNNQLSGKLKEIVAGMAEDDNDLLVMIRFR